MEIDYHNLNTKNKLYIQKDGSCYQLITQKFAKLIFLSDIEEIVTFGNDDITTHVVEEYSEIEDGDDYDFGIFIEMRRDLILNNSTMAFTYPSISVDEYLLNKWYDLQSIEDIYSILLSSETIRSLGGETFYCPLASRQTLFNISQACNKVWYNLTFQQKQSTYLNIINKRTLHSDELANHLLNLFMGNDE